MSRAIQALAAAAFVMDAGADPQAPGLWERVLVAHPRVSHPKENPPKSAAELRAMGEMGYMFGRPMKTLECGPSAIRDYLAQSSAAYRCEPQIKARGGECAFEDNRPGGTGILSNKETVTLTGNYVDRLDVKIRFIRVYSFAPQDAVVDESNIAIRFLGACPGDIKPGERFLVDESGKRSPAP